MELYSVNVRRFRSVENTSLTDNGGFNVLIGKNNSGKSNLLAAVDSFFQCIQSGEVIELTPPIGQDLDFYNTDMEAPIGLTLVFSLSSEERDTLQQDIVNEAPSLENAAESIKTLPWLHATVQVMPPPATYGVVSKRLRQ